METEKIVHNPLVYAMYRKNELSGVQETRGQRFGYAMKLGTLWLLGFGPWAGRPAWMRYGVWVLGALLLLLTLLSGVGAVVVYAVIFGSTALVSGAVLDARVRLWVNAREKERRSTQIASELGTEPTESPAFVDPNRLQS
jgi:hypothetical protein